MEAYVTRQEFKTVLKELKRLQSFLTETFGNKFIEFEVVDKRNDPPESRRTAEKSAKSFNDEDPIDPLRNESEPVVSFVTDPVKRDPLTIEEDPAVPIVASTENLSVPSLPIVVPDITKIEPEHVTPSSLPSSRTAKPVEETAAPSPSTSQAFAGKAPTKSFPEISIISVKKSSTSTSISSPSYLRSALQKTSNTRCDISEEPPGPSLPAKRARLPSLRSSSFTRQEKSTASAPAVSASSSSSSSSSNAAEIIECPQCRLFVYSSQLEEHNKNHTLLNKSSDRTNNFSKSIPRVEDESIFQAPQTCPLCKVICDNYQSYEEHCIDQHPDNGLTCPICGTILSLSTRLKRHLLTHKKLKFTCDICGKCYNRRDNLVAHSKTHENNETVLYYCGFCKRAAFASREGRDRHLNEAHPGHNLPSASISNGNVSTNITPETVKCGSGTDNLLEFEYEGDDEEMA